MEQIRKLTPQQLDRQLETVVSFLQAVHPGLMTPGGYRPSVELRPIPRGIAKTDEKYFPLTWSLNLWDLTEESIDRLRKFLERHNGQPTCLFYSVFTYDNNKKVHTKDGVPAKRGKITTDAAQAAEELALDFDNIGFDAYTELVDRFEDLDIFALWTSSGHGYQTHILLDKPLSDKDLLKKIVYKFRSKGFDCDPNCVDPARIMRLPGTFNNKCFKEEKYAAERSNPPKCSLVQETAERYSLEDILKRLDRLPTVSPEDEEAYLSVETAGTVSANETAKAEAIPESLLAESGAVARLKRIEYPYISDLELPQAVEKMLSYTPEGYRNKALGFMIRFFKNQYKFGKKQIFEILDLWSREACSPAYERNEFSDDFRRLYYEYKGLPYDPALAKKFGAIDFSQIRLRKKNELHIPNKFFHDLAVLGGKEVRLYLAIKMLEHVEEPATQEALTKLLGISDRALRPSIQNLQKRGHCFIKNGNARRGVPNTYHTSHIITADEGYMTFTYNDISAYLNELCEQGSRTRANGELVLYLFFRWKFFSNEIYMSQSNLGKNTGLAQNSISDIVARLQERHFIKITKIKHSPFLESCEYTLLR